MEQWTKKRASETCGGHGMSKFVDSNEAKRLSRLKNVRSSIGNSMSHNGWQKQQIEKRRKEQLRQKKKEAKKKPVGEGIKIETGSGSTTPYEFTKCGLKLKLPQESGVVKRKQEKNPKKASSHLNALRRPCNVPQGLQSNNRRYGPQTPEQRFVSSQVSREKEPIAVNLLDDGSIVSDDLAPGMYSHESFSTSFDQTPSTELLIHDRLQEVSLNQNHDLAMNRGTTQRFRVDEGKENGDNLIHEMGLNQETRQATTKKTAPKKRFQVGTDIVALKKEHADAIEMLKQMDITERNRRRRLESGQSTDSYGSELLSENDTSNQNGDESQGGCSSRCYDNEEILESVGGVQFNKECQLAHQNFDDDCSFFDSDENDGLSACTNSSRSAYMDIQKQDNGAVPSRDNEANDTFTWLPDGMKDATHLSISLRDIEDDGNERDEQQAGDENQSQSSSVRPESRYSSDDEYSSETFY